MKTILILGAGLSASSLIRYLLAHSEAENWHVKIVDQNLGLVQKKINGHPRAEAMSFNALDSKERKPAIAHADLVISMLPAIYHVEVAKDCIELRTDLITPSYISSEMRVLNEEAIAAGIVIMNEIGVDPGIDHMSAMKVIDHIKDIGGKLTSFKSFCGGLLAPESDNNPWHYKFTWNPRNVIVAGQGPAACYMDNNEYKYIPYSQLFKKLDRIEIPPYGAFDGYANRNSLIYSSTYGIYGIPTIYRGTLRRPNYCQGWDVFIQLGMTDDSYAMTNSETLTPRAFLNAFLPYEPSTSVEDKFKKVLGDEQAYLFDQFESMGIFDDSFTYGIENASPAKLLQQLLEPKWKLEPGDKDMLVMYHEFEYQIQNERKKITSSLVALGEDEVYTAMSNTVGLPVAIAAKLILAGELKEKGVTLPVNKVVYEPILNELASFGITFEEKEYTL
jgi:saccharopine dehydrogenase-like NADP-dependent oxidoreductase